MDLQILAPEVESMSAISERSPSAEHNAGPLLGDEQILTRHKLANVVHGPLCIDLEDSCVYGRNGLYLFFSEFFPF